MGGRHGLRRSMDAVGVQFYAFRLAEASINGSAYSVYLLGEYEATSCAGPWFAWCLHNTRLETRLPLYALLCCCPPDSQQHLPRPHHPAPFTIPRSVNQSSWIHGTWTLYKKVRTLSPYSSLSIHLHLLRTATHRPLTYRPHPPIQRVPPSPWRCPRQLYRAHQVRLSLFLSLFLFLHLALLFQPTTTITTTNGNC